MTKKGSPDSVGLFGDRRQYVPHLGVLSPVYKLTTICNQFAWVAGVTDFDHSKLALETELCHIFGCRDQLQPHDVTPFPAKG